MSSTQASPNLYYNSSIDPQLRANIAPGLHVAIVLKKDQPTGILTYGIVQAVLTSAAHHPRGIKVRLASGDVGRVQAVYV